MNLNDPFGRIAHREEKEYKSLSKTLKESNVNTRQEAEVVLQRVQARGKKIAIGVFVALIAVALIFPKAFILVLVFAAILLFWVFKTTLNARKYIQRYIEEEFSESDNQL